MFVKGYSADYISNFNYNDTLRQDSNCLLGPNYSLLLWASIPDNLKHIIPEYYRTLHNSDTETLIISGTLDVSTPSDYAKNELMPHLKNGKQLILNNMSHSDLIFSQVDNYRQVVTDYFKTGKVNPSTYREENINFKQKKNLNKLTKLLYPILFLF
jgi:pimeloyl-ACP methyl ester carboxylesterase